MTKVRTTEAVEIDAGNLAGYLDRRPELPRRAWTVRTLGGGVSNTVLLAESGSLRLVVKQSLPRLRVDEEWLADRNRIHREALALRLLDARLTADSLPRVIFEDPENFLYAMEAAPPGTRDWKTLLLEGSADEDLGRQAGEILGRLIEASQGSAEWKELFGDQRSFDQLRLDPYYRFTASRHPELAGHFQNRVEACSGNATALVHGDFSPKNLLVCPGRLMLIDFEVIHYGDPAFDAAFLLNHLLLKNAHGVRGAGRAALTFWDALAARVSRADFETETIRHLGCLHLARVDGKSPAEYLTGPERARIRDTAREMIQRPPRGIREIFA